jgi:putative flavoprotein involved in K+ transport
LLPRTTQVRKGFPALEDGRVLEVANVVWCTGFAPGLGWIDLDIFDDDGRPVHRRGVVSAAPGLFFVGLQFQYAATSDVLPGVGRDADYIAEQIATRVVTREVEAEPVLDAA